MINPIDQDTSHEWIELYNTKNSTVNVTNWKISDNHNTDELIIVNTSLPSTIPPYGFVLITDQNSKISVQNATNDSVIQFMVDDNSICNGLGNTEDYLLLKNENNVVVDSVEWGNNSSVVAGTPLPAPVEGNSIIRLQQNDSNNTIQDFMETTQPTPGRPNIYSKTGSIHIDICQDFLPKINMFDTYSPPFSIKVSCTNFTPNQSYQLKSFITGNRSTQHPASQTWTGEKWQYSNFYTHTITTDEKGYWNGWLYLRFSKQYKAYQNCIQHNKTCTLHIKIKDNGTVEHKHLTKYLLDFDHSNTHGIPGGYWIGKIERNKTVVLRNESNQTLSCYITEPNNIKEYTPTINEFIILTAPIGFNYTISVLNTNETITSLKTNISINPGLHHFDTATRKESFNRKNRKRFSTTLTINNTGSLADTYFLSITDQSSGFHARLEKTKISLLSGENKSITIYINPLSQRLFELKYGSISVKIISKNNPILQKIHTFSCELHEPDLSIPKIKTYDMNKKETTSCFEGHIFRVKAFLKNKGDEQAHNVTVSYFLDEIQSNSLLGTKRYDSVKQYQKYPSLYWDTHLVPSGKHTIYVVTDYHNSIKELDEHNNQNSINVIILNSTPSTKENKLVISELYYHAYPTIHNEFITLFNPTNKTIHLDNWYLTTSVNKPFSNQKKIIFTNNTVIKPDSTITITQNATAYQQQRMMKPHFEYETDSNTSIPQLETTSTIFLSNKGGSIALKDSFNHTIDIITYGNTTNFHPAWNGSPVPSVQQGEIVKRKKENKTIVDTNTAMDWIQPHSFHINNKLFSPESKQINASIIPFVSPDTSFSVMSNLIEQAQSEILINAYEFTSTSLTNCLIDALHRNVTINLLIEGSPIGGMSNKQRFLLNRLQNHGATIQLLQGNNIQHKYKRYRFTHAKYALFDKKTVVIHSGNFAPTGIPKTSSFGNREWGVAITNETITHFYMDVFANDWNPKREDTLSYPAEPVFKTNEYFLPEKKYYGYYQPVINHSKIFNETITIQPILSPDNSLQKIKNLLLRANESIYIQQLYIYPNWTAKPNPVIPILIKKAQQGVDVKIILNYNPWYETTNVQNNKTKSLLESSGIEVKYVYTNWSIFQNVHNKGVIIDNASVLISSINWNENSFLNNREIGVILSNQDIVHVYRTVFLSDWNLTEPGKENESILKNHNTQIINLNANTIYIAALFTMTFVVVVRDWRKRSWP